MPYFIGSVVPCVADAIACCFLAASPCLGVTSITVPSEPPRTVVMTGEGGVKAMPDMAVVSAGAVTHARTASEAVAANSAIMSRAFSALTALGIQHASIATTGFSLEPQYPPPNEK